MAYNQKSYPSNMSEISKSNGSFLKTFTGTTLGVVAGIILLVCCCISLCFAFVLATQSNVQRPYVDNAVQSTSSASQVFSQGDTINFSGLRITVNSTSIFESNSPYIKPKSGYKFLAIDVTVENVNADPSGYGNPFNFSLKDQDGYTYTDVLVGKDPSIKSDSIGKGEKVRGFLTFEVPSSQTKLQLKYSPSVFSNSITINLQ